MNRRTVITTLIAVAGLSKLIPKDAWTLTHRDVWDSKVYPPYPIRFSVKDSNVAWTEWMVRNNNPNIDPWTVTYTRAITP